jgi:hypothetical protein
MLKRLTMFGLMFFLTQSLQAMESKERQAPGGVEEVTLEDEKELARLLVWLDAVEIFKEVDIAKVASEMGEFSVPEGEDLSEEVPTSFDFPGLLFVTAQEIISNSGDIKKLLDRLVKRNILSEDESEDLWGRLMAQARQVVKF